MKEKMKSFNKENIVLISENIKNMKSSTNPGHFHEVSVTLLWKPVPPFVRLPIPQFLSHSYLNDARVRNSSGRRDVEMSRCGDVATWQSAPCFILHCSKNCFRSCSFRSTVPIFKTEPNHESSLKNCINNIK